MQEISNEQIELMPTVNRSMNDIMKLTPQASTTTSGLAIGGGNYRQSYVTVDGAAFNNAFGIGGNLPAGGSPISLDALEQVSVSDLQLPRQQTLSQDSRRLTERSQRHCYLAVHWQRVLQSSVWL